MFQGTLSDCVRHLGRNWHQFFFHLSDYIFFRLSVSLRRFPPECFFKLNYKWQSNEQTLNCGRNERSHHYQNCSKGLFCHGQSGVKRFYGGNKPCSSAWLVFDFKWFCRVYSIFIIQVCISVLDSINSIRIYPFLPKKKKKLVIIFWADCVILNVFFFF